MLVSESQEVGIGKEFYPSALWGDLEGGGEFRDEQLYSYLKETALQVKVAPDNDMGRHAASRIAVLKPLLQKQSR